MGSMAFFQSNSSRKWRVALGLFLVVGVLAASGCGGGGNTAKVSGKVTYDGKPVTGGSLTFLPAAKDGKEAMSGSANVGQDGSYTVSTYGDGDGAGIGTNMISYSPPPSETPAAGQVATPKR